jgi:hypothetical protein
MKKKSTIFTKAFLELAGAAIVVAGKPLKFNDISKDPELNAWLDEMGRSKSPRSRYQVARYQFLRAITGDPSNGTFENFDIGQHTADWEGLRITFTLSHTVHGLGYKLHVDDISPLALIAKQGSDAPAAEAPAAEAPAAVPDIFEAPQADKQGHMLQDLLDGIETHMADAVKAAYKRGLADGQATVDEEACKTHFDKGYADGVKAQKTRLREMLGGAL